MSSFLCFLCHSTVNSDTNEETREKYREVVGMNLCMDSHLCHICCHVLNKLWLFKAVCLKRSLEYPVLFSEKGTLNLQRNDLEIHTICLEEICGQYHNRNVNCKMFEFRCERTGSESRSSIDNQYVKLEEEREFDDYFQQNESIENSESIEEKDDQAFNTNESEQNVQDKDIYSFNNEHYNQIQNLDSKHEIVTQNDFENDNINNDLVNTIEDCTEGQKNQEVDLKEDNTEDCVKEQNNQEIERTKESKKKKLKKNKKKGFEKIILSLEEQKAELERKRRDKKYVEAEFKCFNCALGFLFKDTYQAHMMRHEESNGEYRCETCTLRFASPAVLRAHIAGHSERHLCGRCGNYMRPQSKNRHARQCWGKESEAACHLCATMFQDASGLQQHLKRYHASNAGGRVYPCSVCGNTYSNQAAVRTHMLKHINRKFDCDQCQSKFSSPYTLAQHKKKHSAVQTELYYCEICNVSYSTKKSLLAHRRNAMNHQQTIFECPICLRTCPNQRSLASHMESVHSASKNYACPTCPARYTNRKSLVRHISSHSATPGAKRAVCHMCGASFKGNNKLNRHLRQVCEKGKLEEEFTDLYNQDCMQGIE